MFSTDHITHNSKKKTERLEVVTAFRKYNIFMCAKEYWTQNILCLTAVNFLREQICCRTRMKNFFWLENLFGKKICFNMPLLVLTCLGF